MKRLGASGDMIADEVSRMRMDPCSFLWVLFYYFEDDIHLTDHRHHRYLSCFTRIWDSIS